MILMVSVYVSAGALIRTIKTCHGKGFLYRSLTLARRDGAYTPNRSRSGMPVIQDPSSDWSVADLHPYLSRLIRGAALSRIGIVRLSIPAGEERPYDSMHARVGRPGESAEVEQMVYRPGLGV